MRQRGKIIERKVEKTVVNSITQMNVFTRNEKKIFYRIMIRVQRGWFRRSDEQGLELYKKP